MKSKKSIFDELLPEAKKKAKKALYGEYMDQFDQYDPYAPEKDFKGSKAHGIAQVNPANSTPNTDIAENATVRDGRAAGQTGQQALKPAMGGKTGGGGGMGPYNGQASINMGEIIGGALGIFNQLIPDDDYRRRLMPQQVYNQNPYGTGSQAIFKKGGNIPKAVDGAVLEDPKPKDTRDPYYEASARMLHYKTILNDKLKAKNPESFGKFFGGLKDIRMKGDTAGAQKYVQDTAYDDYLSPDEVQGTLGDDYQSYLDSLKTVNTYNVSQGQQPLYGTTEGDQDLTKLNYGRRFASMQVTPEVTHTMTNDKDKSVRNYSRKYAYDPASKKVNFTESGDLNIRPSYLAPPAAPVKEVAKMKKGGTIKAKQGLQVEEDKFSHLSSGTIMIEGDSHENGGTMVNYGGQTVEAEAGEPMSISPYDGTATIWGEMNLPGTSTKFKSVAKQMAGKEKEYDFLKTRGSELVTNSNPADKFQKLTFDTGAVMMEGGEIGQADIEGKKAKLASLQRALLDTAADNNYDPQALSEGKIKTAKKGTFKAVAGWTGDPDPKKKPTMADRNNNPGNIKFGEFAKKLGAKKGPAATDGGNFAIFPDRETGFKAMKGLLKTKNYKNLDVNSAITRWTGGDPYNYDLSALGNKKIGELNEKEFDTLVNTMTSGEGTNYGPMKTATPKRVNNYGTPNVTATPPAPSFSPYGLPQTPALTVDPTRPTPGTIDPPPVDEIQVPGDRPIPSNTERLDYKQLLGEMYAFAANDQESVQAQEFNPLLKNPFQVSFQDRINENNSTFNAIQGTLGSNPEALSSMAGQLYRANNSVMADEFRTNQGISNDIANQNIDTLNNAQLKNLQIRDQQYVRQSTAKSKTKATNQMIFNSISDKFMKNEFENKRLAAYENLYDYRFTPTDDGGMAATYYGPDAAFNYGGPSVTAEQNQDVKTTSRFDAQGNLKGYSTQTEPSVVKEIRQLNLQEKKRKQPLVNIRKLFGGQ